MHPSMNTLVHSRSDLMDILTAVRFEWMDFTMGFYGGCGAIDCVCVYSTSLMRLGEPIRQQVYN